MADTGYAIHAEGLNVFGFSDVPIVRLPTYDEALAWANERAEPGRTWVIRNQEDQAIARVTQHGVDEYSSVGMPIYDAGIHLTAIVEDVLLDPQSNSYPLDAEEAHNLAAEIADSIIAAGWPHTTHAAETRTRA